MEIHKTYFIYNVGEEIKNERLNIKILQQFTRPINRKDGKIENSKMYCVHCYDCGADVPMYQSSIKRKSKCPCCTGSIIVKGINDLTTTDPWIIKYFQGGADEAKLYSRGTDKTFFPICPFCGRISDHPVTIGNLVRQKTFGCICKDNISYPEKFFYNLLIQLNEKFIYQLSNKDFKWCKKYKYDFYLKDKNIIIEVNGMQHYTSNKVINNDLNKHNLAKNNVYKYISIDCSESKKDYIKNNIINSELNNILNLNDIDWNACEEFAMKNLSVDIWSDFNNGIKVAELSQKYNVSKNKIRRILHVGTELNKCRYDGEAEHKKSIMGSNYNNKETKVFDLNGNLLGTYKSAKYISDNSLELFGKKLYINSIYDCCNYRIRQYKGFVFKNK